MRGWGEEHASNAERYLFRRDSAPPQSPYFQDRGQSDDNDVVRLQPYAQERPKAQEDAFPRASSRHEIRNYKNQEKMLTLPNSNNPANVTEENGKAHQAAVMSADP